MTGRHGIADTPLRALKVLDFVIVKIPDTGGDFIDQVLIVGDQEDGTFIFLERLIQCVDGFQIEVVSRLIQDEKFGFCIIRRQKSRRAASPPDNASVGFKPSSPLNNIWPSTPRISSLVAFGSN